MLTQQIFETLSPNISEVPATIAACDMSNFLKLVALFSDKLPLFSNVNPLCAADFSAHLSRATEEFSQNN